MAASSPTAPSRKRKTRQNPIVMPQIVLALAAPNINPKPIQRIVSSTKPQSNCSGLGLTPPSQHPGCRRLRRKQEAAASHEHEHQLHSPTTNNNNATKRTTKIQSNYSVRQTARSDRKTKQEAAGPQEREHEEKKGMFKMIRLRVLDPDATESSTDTRETNVAVKEQPKRKKVEIVHEIQMLEENPRPRKLEMQETSKKKESKKNKKICLSSRSSSPSCKDEGRGDEEILKGSSITSSIVQMAARKLVLYDVPGPIPDLEEFLKLDYDLHFLLTFFDDLPDD